MTRFVCCVYRIVSAPPLRVWDFLAGLGYAASGDVPTTFRQKLQTSRGWADPQDAGVEFHADGGRCVSGEIRAFKLLAAAATAAEARCLTT